jgi:hypothetical protein
MAKKHEIPAEYDKTWVRMPKHGPNIHGLSRTALFELGFAGKIRWAHHRKPGRIKGVRLIWLPSVGQYLDQLADESQKQAAKE